MIRTREEFVARVESGLGFEGETLEGLDLDGVGRGQQLGGQRAMR